MIICHDQRSGNGCGAANPDDARFCMSCGQPLRFGLVLRNPGELVGNYRIVRVLGHGMFGAVYEAESPQQRWSHVALKETIDPASVNSFRTEFATLHDLHHPGLPRYYELFEALGNAYLVMELAPGQTLDELSQQRAEGLEEGEVLGYARQLCAVLSYLHGHQPCILHRDIKPANVRLTPQGVIKLVDFGLLKQGTQQTRRSIRGIGTPAYAPIEQYGGGLTDPRSDIYSLGATLYHLLTGQEPLPATDRIATTPDPLPSLHQLNSRVSRHVSEAVLKAMALAQPQRWSDAAAFERALFAGTAAPRAPRTGGLRGILGRLRGERSPSLRQSHKLAGHRGGAWCAAYSPDSQLLASGGSDRVLRLWRVADASLLDTLRGHSGEVMCLAWHPAGQILACGCSDGSVMLWRIGATNVPLGVVRAHTASVLCIAWHPSGRYLASSGQDGVVLLAHLADGDGHIVDTPAAMQNLPPPERLGSHAKMVLSLVFSPDGSTLSSAGLDGSVRIWQM